MSIVDLLDDLLELQASRLQVNGIKIVKKYKSRGIVRGFYVELKQVFLNLIGNAIQEMPEGGTPRIAVSERSNSKHQHDQVSISICDTGLGVRPEHAKRVFEPFFSTKAAKGTGLGLWISKRIIQKYEGSIHFRSIPFNGGNITCFRVTIPRVGHPGEPETSMIYAGVAENDSGIRGPRGSN